MSFFKKLIELIKRLLMTLNASGPISLGGTTAGQSIELENGGTGTTQISLNDTAVRSLAGVPTTNTQIIMPTNFYGKSNTFSFTVAAGANLNLRTLAVAAGWNGTAKVLATINSGSTIYSTSTGTPALTVDGSFPGGVQLTNYGSIIGMYGAGGSGNIVGGAGTAGSAGGTALSVAVACTVVNNTVIGGGGGGGGGGGTVTGPGSTTGRGNGGQGGGSNGSTTGTAGLTPSATGGGAGGSGGAPGANGGAGGNTTAGTGVLAEGGGGGGGGIGGAGGAGGAGSTTFPGIYPGGAGGGAGSCTSGISNISWTVTGTRYGPLN